MEANPPKWKHAETHPPTRSPLNAPHRGWNSLRNRAVWGGGHVHVKLTSHNSPQSNFERSLSRFCCCRLIGSPAARGDPGGESFPVNCTSLHFARISSGVKQKVILGTSFPAVLRLVLPWEHEGGGGLDAGRCACLYFKLNPDLSAGVPHLNTEGLVSKQRGSLHRLFAVEICRALIASAGTRNPSTEF